MKTLIIHPVDRTTDFLCEVYKDVNCTVIRADRHTSRKSLVDAINEHDKIIFLGHGDKHGLYGNNRYIIDSRFVYLLRQKPNIICVWCNADEFMRKYQLLGFATGMIISELEESYDYSVLCSYDQLVESNRKFALALSTAITGPVSEVALKTKTTYDSIDNPVITFNGQNFFHFEESKQDDC